MKSLSIGSIAGQPETPALNRTVGSRMQQRMTHQISWGGPCRRCHVDLVVVRSCFTPLVPPPTPLVCFFFMAIFACICFSFLSARDGEESSTWGGWAGSLHVVEWSATRAWRHEPDRKSERELAAWLVVPAIFPVSQISVVCGRRSSSETQATHVKWRARVLPRQIRTF